MAYYELTTPDTDSAEYARARYHYLLQIEFGESLAIDFCKTIALFAPNEKAKAFLLKQQEDEERHLDMMTDYIGSHMRTGERISKYMRKMDAILRDAVERQDYVGSIFVQNFIIEGLNISMLLEIEHHADGELSELLSKVLKDEMTHMQFGINEIKRILSENKSKLTIKKLISLQRRTIFYAVIIATQLSRDAKYLGIPMNEFAKKVFNDHFDRIREANFPLPWVDRLAFRGVIVFLKLI
jgi:rubrerythrin